VPKDCGKCIVAVCVCGVVLWPVRLPVPHAEDAVEDVGCAPVVDGLHAQKLSQVGGQAC
jgi:hypothetical protein